MARNWPPIAGSHQPRPASPQRRRHTAATLLAVLTAIGWSAFLISEFLLQSDIDCDLSDGRSVFGEATWGLLPPGTTCTWLIDGAGGPLVHVDAPSGARLLVTAVLLAWLVTIWMLRPRRGSPRQDPAKT